jgi:alkanesulfonate monooxygenase SsuD/methylene tetrahydromethanopterin reductase-like flavin-dependent oxidoreductase (luciferase family)
MRILGCRAEDSVAANGPGAEGSAMKFGMLHFFEHAAGGKTEHQIVREQLDCMRAAEDMGFDSIWAPEHHFTEYGFCASPMLTLAAMSSVTKRIRLGSGVVVLPFNDPVRVAEEGAMIDLMSGGRLELGVGRGFQPVEYRGFAVDQSKSREIFEEALQVIVQAWTEGRVSFKGAHFDIPEHSVRPVPMQKPHPPIWVAAVSDDTFALAGRLGFNLLCSLVYGFKSDYTALLLSTYRNSLRVHGHNPAQREVGALCMVYCAESTHQARQDFGGPVLWYFRTIANYITPPAGQKPSPGTRPMRTSATPRARCNGTSCSGASILTISKGICRREANGCRATGRCPTELAPTIARAGTFRRVIS